jgi:hypothetical protein
MDWSRGSKEGGSSGKKTRLAAFELVRLSEQAAKVAIGLGRPASLTECLVAPIQAARTGRSE